MSRNMPNEIAVNQGPWHEASVPQLAGSLLINIPVQGSVLVAQQNDHLGQEMLNIDMEREKLQEEIKQVMAALEQVQYSVAWVLVFNMFRTHGSILGNFKVECDDILTKGWLGRVGRWAVEE